MSRRLVNITVNGQNWGQEYVSEEFADGVEAYNFKDSQELSDIMYHVDRCTHKGLYSWCPADTKTLKRYLGMEV